MSETLVEDGATYPASVNVPEDGDARNAASVVVGFQSLANRCAYFYTKLATLITGGALTTPDDVTWTVADDKALKIQGDPAGASNGNVDFTDVYTDFNGFVRGPLFAGNQSGRANRKPWIDTGAATLSFNARLYDTIRCTPTGSHNVDVLADANYVDGDTVLVTNHSVAYQITVRDPAAVSLAILAAGSIGAPTWCEIIYNSSTSAWSVLRRS